MNAVVLGTAEHSEPFDYVIRLWKDPGKHL